MTEPVLVSEYRGSVLENVHRGVVCGVKENKEVIFQKGNIKHITLYRSAMKALQSIPVFKTDVIEKHKLTSSEAALFTASHRGEDYHRDGLQSLLNKCGLSEKSLILSETYPLNDKPMADCLWNHVHKRKIFHNCSGKHLGFLACSKEKGWDIDTYYLPEHPIQQNILKIVSNFAEVPAEDISRATDGCGAPVYAVPLYNMALSYLKFVCPGMIADPEIRNSIKKIGEVMNENPEIVASHQFVCTELLRDPNIIAKGGAQGVYCFALRKEKLSFSLKVLSGSESVWSILIARILEKINYENKETIDRLYQLRSKDIKNDNEETIGSSVVHLD